jgi:hypothetical protein
MKTTITAEELDERRAREAFKAYVARIGEEHLTWDGTTESGREAFLHAVRAIRTADDTAGMNVLTLAAENDRLREIEAAAEKCLPVMRSLGWQMAAASAGNGSRSISDDIEALAATECYYALEDALEARGVTAEDPHHG